ncbi:MAG TPA: CoA ester lyase [Nitrososphaeraceae archaeon]|nr:CoA ester lyase [Nitrososphaeraceae archaeon]
MLYRSLIFVPGNNKRFVEKAKTLPADIVCFDLEDSVPLNEKNAARKTIADALMWRTEYKSSFYLRINSLDSSLWLLDLEEIIRNGIDGVVVPKVNDEAQIKNIDTQLSEIEDTKRMTKKSIKLMPSIESAKGIVNAYSIATSSQRINAMVFGIFDYLYDMGLDYVENDDIEKNMYGRAKLPVDAHAAGVECIDGIWQKVDDTQGLIRDATIAKRLGYSGKCIIHPTQIDPVHKVFVPSQSQINWATRVVEALREAMEKGHGLGAVKLEGKMIDAVHYKQAKAILEYSDDSRLENDGKSESQ